MAAPAVKHDPQAIESPIPNTSTSNTRKQPPPPKLKPRSAGFSRASSVASISEFDDIHRTDKLIRKVFDDSRQERPREESSELSSTRHQSFRRQIKRLLQTHSPSPQEAPTGKASISSTFMIAQQTPRGRKYGQIVMARPYDVSLDVSTYNVNKVEESASVATQKNIKRKKSVKGPDMNSQNQSPSKKDGNSLPASKQKQPPQIVRNDIKGHKARNDEYLDEKMASTPLIDDIPKPYVDAPVIPSPRKSVFKQFLDSESNWAESFSASQESEANEPTTRTSTSEPISRDFATTGAHLLQRLRDNRRRSRSPEKKATPQDAVAGLSHQYPTSPFPSFRQRIKDLQASNAQSAGHTPLKSPSESQHPPPAPPPSPSAITSGGGPMLKPSPIIEHHSKSSSIVSAESAAEEVQSDASSGVVSNAQSAIFMRGHIATGRFHAANTRKPPMPGPPPNGALPSLPEGHHSSAPHTPRLSESSQRVNSPANTPEKVVVPTKSPKRLEYRFLPSDCSPPKTKGPIPPEQLSPNPSEQFVPPSTQVRVKRQGVAFSHPDQVPKFVNVDDSDQWQQQRDEKTTARKARDLARMRSHKATVEDMDGAALEGTNGVEHHDGITVLPNVGEPNTPNVLSAGQKTHASQASDFSLSTTLQNRESSVPSNTRESSPLSQKLSPIVVVAEQEPTSSSLRYSSQNSQTCILDSTNEGPLRSRFSRESTEEPPPTFQTNGFHPGLAHPVSPSLHLPYDEIKARPRSVHSMPTPRPVASRTPTPFTHSLLRAQSNRSSERTSMHGAQVSELEARLSAIEKKNVMLERAFLAVINTSAAYGGFGGADLVNGSFDVGEGSSDGVSSNGNGGSGGERSSGESTAERLYAGLEALLALHANEVGKRLSTSSGPP